MLILDLLVGPGIANLLNPSLLCAPHLARLRHRSAHPIGRIRRDPRNQLIGRTSEPW